MRRTPAMLACLAAVASPAMAAEFVPGVEVLSGWDSNVFRSSQNEESAFFGQFGPNLELRDQAGALQYDLHYRMPYEVYPTVSGINAFQYYLTATGSYQFDPRTSISVRENFSKASSAVQIFNNQTATTGLVQLNQQNTRQELLVNDVNATLLHMLSPVWQLQLSFDYTLFEYPQSNQASVVAQSSSTSMTGTAQITRAISPRTTLGFGSSVTRQDFQTTGGQSGRGATFYNAFGIVNYKLTPTLTFSASAGPAIDDPDTLNAPTGQLIPAPFFPLNSNRNPVDPNTCPFQGNFRVFDPLKRNSCQPVFIPPTLKISAGNVTQVKNPVPEFNVDVPFLTESVSKVQPTLTYYGHLSLEKKWETLTATLAYSRTASTASGLAASTNLDTLSASFGWSPTHEWTVTGSVAYDRQTSASKSQQPILVVGPAEVAYCQVLIQVPGQQDFCLKRTATVARTVGVTTKLVNNAFEFNSYSAELNASRRISKNLTLTGTFDWWTQSNTGKVQAENSNRQDIRITFGFIWSFNPIPLWTEDL